MIVFCKAYDYNHTESLKKFGYCVEFDIPDYNAYLKYAYMLNNYTKIDYKYLILWFYGNSALLRPITWAIKS